MPLNSLDRGERVDIHLELYSKELEVLDALARKYNTSRAAVVGAWCMENVALDLTGKTPEPKGAGRKAIRRG